jgi:hypothetical protein
LFYQVVKGYIRFHLTLLQMAYKRNQIIEAIESALDPSGDRPASQILTRLKRLLNADRILERDPRSASAEESTYAFFSGQLAGSGNENWYSPFEAFAMFLGMRLMESGFPQRTVVRILRSVRTELEDSVRTAWRSDLAGNKGARLYLARIAPERPSEGSRAGSVRICRGEAAVAKFLAKSSRGEIMTVFELTSSMARFKAALEVAIPSKRGRNTSK